MVRFLTFLPMPVSIIPPRFPTNARNRFFSCRRCRNHVAHIDNCGARVQISLGREGILCNNPINVRNRGIVSRRLLRHLPLPVVTVQCSGCHAFLGERFIEHSTGQGRPYTLMEGSYLFFLDRLLFWDGTQMLCADTNEPFKWNAVFKASEIL